jgi:hypothetical protein
MMEGVEAGPPEEPKRSSFEDYEIPDPSTMSTPVRRPAVLTTAAVVLVVAAMTNLLFVVGFGPDATTAAIAIALGIGQAIGAVLILLRHPVGYAVGIAMGAIGVVTGLVRAGDDAISALMTIALSGFVIWAVASNRPSFRRR